METVVHADNNRKVIIGAFKIYHATRLPQPRLIKNVKIMVKKCSL